MRRTTLTRKAGLSRGKTPLARKTPLRASSGALSRSASPARGVGRARQRRRERALGRASAAGREWYDFPRSGRCEGCGRPACRREAHHVLVEGYVRRIAPDRIFDVANRLLLGVECCHGPHHRRGVNDRRLSYRVLRPESIAFARELLGGAAERYFRARYRDAP